MKNIPGHHATGASENRLLPRNREWQPKALHPDYRSTTFRAPSRPLIAFPTTPSEETGPVFGHSLVGKLDSNLVVNAAQPGESAIGPRILVHGTVSEANGRRLDGVLIEIWQANAGGRYRHVNDDYLAPLDPNFSGCGRAMTDEQGRFEFMTIMPGPYPWPNGGNDWRPAHIHFSLFGPSFAQRLITQMYFEGDPLIPRCPIISSISQAAAVDTLVARLDLECSEPMDCLAYRFDILLRGRNATYIENRD